MIRIPNHIGKLEAYKAGKPISELKREKGLEKVVKLASNESPYGPPSSVLENLEHHFNDVFRYPDPSNYELKSELAKHLSIEPERILVGGGSDALLADIVMSLTIEGDEILSSKGTFIGTKVNVEKLNRVYKTVPLNRYHYDLQAMRHAMTGKIKMIYIANPNNPTGTYIPTRSLEDFLESVSKDIVVVLDQAYFEYAEVFEDYPGLVPKIPENVIILRTFSKAWGLAGLRVAYAMGDPEILKIVRKVRLPFEPTTVSASSAVSALQNSEYIDYVIHKTRAELYNLQEFLQKHQIPFVEETAANFFLLTFENQNVASEFTLKCLDKGLILRQTTAFGLPECVRINIGLRSEMAFAFTVIAEVWESMQ